MSKEEISDEELVDLFLSKLERRKIDFDNPKDVAEFFDEDWSDVFTD